MQVLSGQGANVVVYYNDRHKQGLKSFLTHQQGVVCTSVESFSGMEAARVIWVQGYGSGDTESRSAVLRAVSRLAIVCRGWNGSVRMAPDSVTLDTQFARCLGGYTEGWECFDCSMEVCAHCGVVCHAHCKDAQ